MAKQLCDDYGKEIEIQRAAWNRKAVLRVLYGHWYRQIIAQFGPLEPTVEIGSGSGNFKEFCPRCVATDVRRYGPWIDRELDAEALDLKDGEAGNLVAIDVLHHLRRPVEFLRQAAKALKPGGRVVLFEPAAAGWGRLIYGCLHHEPLDFAFDPFAQAPLEPDPHRLFANAAIPEIMFWRRRARTLQVVPELRLVFARRSGCVVYPLTGGFNYPSLLPRIGLTKLLSLEDFLLRPVARFTSLRMLVVLEKAVGQPGA